ASLFQAILVALGRAEAELATGESFRQDRTTGRSKVRPMPWLSSDWICAAQDETPEFDLALALAGVYDAAHRIGPLCANLESVDWRKSRLDWAVKDRSVVWNSASLGANLSAVLSRRVMDGLRAGCERLPLAFAHG